MNVAVEGHELQVLDGADAALTAHRIAIIQMEVGVDPLIWPLTRFEDVRRRLEPLGYYLHGFFEQHRIPVQPPDDWPDAARHEFHASVMNRCEAVFISASLKGAFPRRNL
jgi:hypothetical protein